MSFKSTLKQLLPPVSYDKNADEIDLAIAFDSFALDKVLSNAQRVLDALNPSKSRQMLSDWERVFGLKSNGIYSARVEAVIARINAVGGLSIHYFMGLAKANNININIDEPQPFRAGTNRAGDALNAQDVMWLWVVNVSETSLKNRKFNAGLAVAGQTLLSFERSAIEQLFEQLKPAHTHCHFNYL